MTKRRIETVVIQGVNLLTGEKSRLDLPIFRDKQQPRSRGAPICTQSSLPTLTKKEVTLDLLLYWSLRSQRLILRETQSSKCRQSRVSASSTEEMLLHCNCPLLAEKEHQMLSVSKLVSKSYLKRSGSTRNWDQRLRVGLIAELGKVKQSHLAPRSLARTNLLIGTTHLLLSSDFSMLRSQKRTPFLYPRAFCSSYPPSWRCSSLPPGAEQKLTMSSLKQSGVCALMS